MDNSKEFLKNLKTLEEMTLNGTFKNFKDYWLAFVDGEMVMFSEQVDRNMRDYIELALAHHGYQGKAVGIWEPGSKKKIDCQAETSLNLIYKLAKYGRSQVYFENGQKPNSIL